MCKHFGITLLLKYKNKVNSLLKTLKNVLKKMMGIEVQGKRGRKAKEEVVGQCESRSQGEGTVRVAVPHSMNKPQSVLVFSLKENRNIFC